MFLVNENLSAFHNIFYLNNAVLTTYVRLTIILMDHQSDGYKMINQKVASNSQREDADEVAIDHLPSVINNI